MGFFAGLFVNSFLVAIPIGATLGVLFAIRPFEGERQIIVETDGVQTQTSCDEFHTFLQNKNGLNYTLNSNEVRSEANTFLCSTVTTFQNSTYPGNTTVPEFSVTWSYPYRVANESSPANETAPAIHAFPQARIADGGPLPIKMEDIGALNIDFAWTMAMGKNTSYATNTRRLSAENVNTTVALDMYLDSDKDSAAEASKAATEMIIFFARFSDADPVGFGNGTVIRTQSVEGVDFHLFVGKNAAAQNVFSWVSARPLYEFKGDIAPLFDGVMALRGDERVDAPLPSFFDYLGYVGFGTQAFNADDDVTFYVPRLSIDVQAF